MEKLRTMNFVVFYFTTCIIMPVISTFQDKKY